MKNPSLCHGQPPCFAYDHHPEFGFALVLSKHTWWVLLLSPGSFLCKVTNASSSSIWAQNGNAEHQLSVPKRHSRSSPRKWSSLCQREILIWAVGRISLNLDLQRASKQSGMDQTHKGGGNPKSANTARAKSAGEDGEGRRRPCTPSPHPLQGPDLPVEPSALPPPLLLILPNKAVLPRCCRQQVHHCHALCWHSTGSMLTNCWLVFPQSLCKPN